MDDDEEAARKYRKRAEEVRTIAEMMRSEKMRGILFSVAEEYDRMAETRLRISNRKNAG